jgi:hypothetical protein
VGRSHERGGRIVVAFQTRVHQRAGPQQVLPDARLAGVGREAPNKFPTLPDPHGRTSFLANLTAFGIVGALSGRRGMLFTGIMALGGVGGGVFMFGSSAVSAIGTFASFLPKVGGADDNTFLIIVGVVAALLLLCCCGGCCLAARRCSKKPKIERVEVDLHGSVTELLLNEGSSDAEIGKNRKKAAEDADDGGPEVAPASAPASAALASPLLATSPMAAVAAAASAAK